MLWVAVTSWHFNHLLSATKLVTDPCPLSFIRRLVRRPTARLLLLVRANASLLRRVATPSEPRRKGCTTWRRSRLRLGKPGLPTSPGGWGRRGRAWGQRYRGFRRHGKHQLFGIAQDPLPSLDGNRDRRRGQPHLLLQRHAFHAGSQNLYAFDASGQKDSAGTPTVCTPLWMAPIGTNSTVPETAAVNAGMVYVANPATGTLYAFDDHGTTDCSGSPKACSPLWTASGVAGSPAVGAGTWYIAGSWGHRGLRRHTHY